MNIVNTGYIIDVRTWRKTKSIQLRVIVPSLIGVKFVKSPVTKVNTSHKVLPKKILPRIVNETVPKTFAKDILQKECNVKACCGCGDSLVGPEIALCEISGDSCHNECLFDPVDGTVCISCENNVTGQ